MKYFFIRIALDFISGSYWSGKSGVLFFAAALTGIYRPINSVAQVPTQQDCLGSIAICQTTYSETNAFSGTGNYPNEIDSVKSCLKSGEKNDVWYAFTVQTPGAICFTLTPNNAADDYDWAVFNLTSATCTDIFTNGALEVSCNYAPNPGPTGPNGQPGPQNAPCMNVSSGENYVINVSQFSVSLSGYTINFSASTASIFDNTSPSLSSVNTPILCSATSITFNFSEKVLCNTVQSGDFLLTGPGGPYTLSNVAGAACVVGGKMENTFTANVSPAILTGGSYSICINPGSGITDLCGNAAPSTCLSFNVTGVSVAITSSTNVNCFGASTGSATASAGAGNPPYTFIWSTSPPQSGTTATGLSGGSYSVTATDATGCMGTATVTITSPTVIISPTNVSCDSLTCDGSATAMPVGGTSPYTYQWYNGAMIAIPGETNATVLNLCVGAYCVVTKDASSCTDTTCLSIVMPSVSISPQSPSCIGACDGAANATALGGTPPFTYQWQNPLGTPIPGATDSNLTGQCAGKYYLRVTTGSGCILIDSVTIVNPVIISSGISGKNSCFSTCDGTVTAIPAGGTPPYSYSWNDPASQTTPTATGLCAGTYTVSVTDSKGCGPVILSLSISQAPAMSLTTSVVHTSCSQPDGIATAVVSGGSPPYVYFWDDPGNTTVSSATGLPAGNYNVIVTDSIGCKDTAVAAVGYTDSNTAVITINKQISCKGLCDGQASVVIVGGLPPYTYSWSTKAVTASIDTVCADTVTVTATDSTGCPAASTVVFTDPPAIVGSIVGTNVNCTGNCTGAADLTVTGGTPPYTYLWAPGGNTTQDLNGLCAGNYSVTVTDANNCPPDSQSVQVTEPLPLALAIATSCVNGEGTIDLSVSGGTAPYNYSWSNGAATEDIAGLSPGSYTVTVTDAKNCPPLSKNTSITPCLISVPDAFTPNGNGQNDIWEIKNLSYFPECLVKVYNRWGDQVFSSKGYETPWDGKKLGVFLPAAVYYYVIENVDLKYFENPGNSKGWIIIVR